MIIEGTIIEGTLRPEDLLPAFFSALKEIAPATAKVRLEGTYSEELQHAINGTLEEYLAGSSDKTVKAGENWEVRVDTNQDRHEYVAWAIEAISDDLDANAPDGFYFGTLEGDASDFGFWRLEEF